MTDAATSGGARVSVLVPARNEAADIDACLDHVLAQDLPHHLLEVVVVDGGSTDGTGARAAARLADAGLARWAVVDNPEGTTPSNLNRGLAEVTGDVVCRVDARSLVPPDYVRRCAELLRTRPEVAVVGGAQVALARDRSTRAVGIARALNNRYGMGGSRYRRGAPSGPADTVYLGSFRTTDLQRAGGWDEAFTTNQDFELNRRMSATGVVWFEAGLEVGYLPRERLTDLWRQYVRFGRWKVRYWRTTADRPRSRQVVLLVAPPVGVAAAVVAWRVAGTRARAIGLTSAVGAAAAVEVRGSSGPPGAPATHAVSLVASALVAGGWLVGVVAELVRRR